MAPNKKKKKAASNPARGFATTSTASKPKATEDTDNIPETQDHSETPNVLKTVGQNQTSSIAFSGRAPQHPKMATSRINATGR